MPYLYDINGTGIKKGDIPYSCESSKYGSRRHTNAEADCKAHLHTAKAAWLLRSIASTRYRHRHCESLWEK